MNNKTLEVLVILTLGHGGNVGDTVSPLDGVITQVISERIAAVKLPAENVAQLNALDWVERVIIGKIKEAEMSGLTEEEKLFVQAWVSRKAEQEKQRSGDGMDWDESGFSAP